jgi:L-alanine-DL-glutamate epimerase-like enolase superfamily enzyme
MKITEIKFEELTGVWQPPFPLFEERLIRPIDVYPEHQSEVLGGGRRFKRLSDGSVEITSVFLSVSTDEGITGIAGPVELGEAFFVQHHMADIVIGEDPLATERIWDKVYRHLIHGRKGRPMFAVSALDCALWDIRGKAADLPVYRLLGGPVRRTFPAYASALGFAIDPEKAADRARSFSDQGYTAQKWFFRYGPMDGEIGAQKNIQLVRTIRQAVGSEVDIMLDAWNSWDVRYAMDMARRLAEYRPRWIEEVVKPDDIPGYARVRAASPVPIAGGEHEYTRWGARDYLTAGAVDVYQADTFWAGGISEMMKIFALASAFEVQAIPHGHSVPVNAHLTAAQSPTLTPYIEYLVQWNEIIQFFLAHPIRPVDGQITVSDRPGLGLEIDDSKVTRRRTVEWE